MANEIFVGQSLLLLNLETNLDISSGSNPKIRYQKPSGATGEWVATVNGTTKVQYNVLAADLDEDGVWIFQSYIEVGGQEGYGAYVEKEVEPIL